jgi:hypothetical protein
MKAILSVTVREGYTITSADGRWQSFHEDSRILYHSRKGLTQDKSKATKFKTLEYAVKAARKKYSPRLAPLHSFDTYYLSRDLQSWSATEIKETTK